MNGALYKDIGTGLLSSYKNQKRALKALDIEFTESFDNSCDILQINTPWIYSLYIIHKARKQGKKIIIWSHVTAEDARRVFWFNKYFFGLIKKYLTYAYGKADLVFCPTEYTKGLLIAYGLPAEKLIAVSNGVDTSMYYKDLAKREEGRKEYNLRDVVVGTVGLVIPRKGTDKFIELARDHSDNRFMWFGKQYNRFMVPALPKDLPENINFTGYVKDILSAFNSLDIFIFLSEEDNQGMVILEAASIGLPILVRDLPAYRGWLVHNENCLIAKNDDEVNEYLEMLITDMDLRERLGRNALELSKREDIHVVGQKALDQYTKLLQAN